VKLLAEELKKITLDELKQYDGKSGKPAYIAYQGKVYDVSQSRLWSDGDHMGLHGAGKDHTDELDLAPHREEVFERARLVGTVV